MQDDARALYAGLGARPVINAVGNMTMLGGSTPSPRVRRAMETASRYWVDMDELLAGSGRVVAGMLGCQAALVTSGCAGALVLGTAACMTGTDAERMMRLPDTTGMKGEVVIQKGQRFKYDRVVRMTGARLVEAGSAVGTSAEELHAAMGLQTAALLYPAHDQRPGLVPLRQAIEVAHGRGVPVLVDAASRVYPVDGLKQYAAWGADLVGYGAKYFGAPNSTGLLCGREDLVEAARLHTFACFETRGLGGFGRPLKVDRQEVAAVVEALREWLEMDHGARYAAARARAGRLRAALAGLPHAAVEDPGPAGSEVVRLALDEGALGRSAAQVTASLRQADPAVWLVTEGPCLVLYLMTVPDGDEEVVAQQLKRALQAA
ncbi:MAG: hypothetical protein AB1505_12755 [Candidatus Latescibacterota bacterium]